MSKESDGRSDALARHCADDPAGMTNTDLFRSARVAIGAFRCGAGYPSFHDTGPTRQALVVFPRTGVWIRHEGSRRFLADPTLVTIYNRAQRYERFRASPEGDRCDWFAVSDDVAHEIAASIDASAADMERPYRFEWGPSSAALYVRQRALWNRARAGLLDALEAEEAIMAVVGDVLRFAYAHRGEPIPQRRATGRHVDIADAARAELLRTVTENRSVHDIALVVGTSPYHLCRVFKATTGRTLHAHRTELRLRMALELLPAASRRGDSSRTLSTVAHDLGFASHSHFVHAMRRHARMTPSAARALLSAS